MKQILFILFLFPMISGAEEATDSQYATEEKIQPVSGQCSKFLKAFQKEAVSLMEDSAKNYKRKSRMFTEDPRLCLKSNKCSKLFQSHMDEAKSFQDHYLQNLLETNLSNGDRGFGLPPFVSTSSGTKVSTREFSDKMKKKVFQKLKHQQKSYMADWLKLKMSERYPRWKECVRFESKGRVSLELQKSRKKRHFYKPAFVDLEKVEAPELKKQCAQLQGAVHASKNSRWIRNRFIADQKKSWDKFMKKQKKPVPHWLTYMDRRLSGLKNDKEKKRAIASTYNKMGNHVDQYVNGTGYWSLLGYGSRHGFKKEGSKSERELWFMANSMDYFKPMLHKNCPSRPWWGLGEGVSSAAKEVLPGVGHLDRVSETADNEILTLAHIKSLEESYNDRRQIYNTAARNGAMDLIPIPGAKLALKGIGKGIAAVAPRSTDRLLVRAAAKKMNQATKVVSKGGEKLLKRLEAKGFGDSALYKKGKVAHKYVVRKMNEKTVDVVSGQAVEQATEAVSNADKYVNELVEYASKKGVKASKGLSAEQIEGLVKKAPSHPKKRRQYRKFLKQHANDPLFQKVAQGKNADFLNVLYQINRAKVGKISTENIGRLYMRYKRCQRQTNNSRSCARRIRKGI